MQIQSIANDGDIQYRPEDISRAMAKRFDDLPNGLFLIKTQEGKYFYAKEFSYALLAALFYKVLGDNGILLFNALMFSTMLILGYRYLRLYNDEISSLLVSTLYFSLSTAIIYLIWIHTEIYNMFLIMVMAYLLVHHHHSRRDCHFILATLIAGIAFSAKVANVSLYLPFLVARWSQLRVRSRLLCLIFFMIPVTFSYGYYYMQTGALSFYSGNRLLYLNSYPFWPEIAFNHEIGRKIYSISEVNIDTMISITNLAVVPYNIFYYFFGRFTGMFWYFPLTIPALVSAIRQLLHKKKLSDCRDQNKLLLIGIAVYIVIFVTIAGNNYFGGQHAVGNRYFYIYPAFLFLMHRVNLKGFLLLALTSLVTVGPIISSPIANSSSPERHTFAWPYRFMPIEYSQLRRLPLWTHHMRSDDVDFYNLSESSRWINGGLLIESKCDVLARLDLPIRDLQILVTSSANGNNISVRSRHRTAYASLDEGRTKELRLAELAPVYRDNLSCIYRFTARARHPIWMRINVVPNVPLSGEAAKTSQRNCYEDVFDRVATYISTAGREQKATASGKPHGSDPLRIASALAQFLQKPYRHDRGSNGDP